MFDTSHNVLGPYLYCRHVRCCSEHCLWLQIAFMTVVQWWRQRRWFIAICFWACTTRKTRDRNFIPQRSLSLIILESAWLKVLSVLIFSPFVFYMILLWERIQISFHLYADDPELLCPETQWPRRPHHWCQTPWGLELLDNSQIQSTNTQQKSFTDVISSAASLAASQVYFAPAPSYLSELLTRSDPLVGPLC